MRYETIKGLKEEEFRRLTGVKRKTFDEMAGVLMSAKAKQKAQGGKPNSLCMEDQLLMMLGYWREYRTYFHIGQTYGKSESQAYRIIKWCEDTLIKSKMFRLPGRKAVAASDRAFDVILIDATETPIERPQKSNGVTIRERRSGTR
jgi:hypothetical protein